MRDIDFYGGQDPREMPAYGLREAAHYLLLPPSTLRDWVKGWSYSTEKGQQFSAPLITLQPLSPGAPLTLSFFNVIEAHVLRALRREHRIAMHKVREALTYLEQRFPSKHPLVDQKIETDGMDLFLEKYGQLINITQPEQLAMRRILQMYLCRIERDTFGVPDKLYLFTRARSVDEPKVIAMDPYVSFGRPVLVGTGITTAIIAERYKAGESIEELASDYARPPRDIQEAIRCELETKAA